MLNSFKKFIESKRGKNNIVFDIVILIKDCVHYIKSSYVLKYKIKKLAHLSIKKTTKNGNHDDILAARVADNNFFIARRLDLVAKYLYLKNRKVNLYRKHLEQRTGGKERRDYFLGRSKDLKKNSVDDYEDAFLKLLKSMSEKGFDPEYPIPMYSGTLLPENGAHRLVCSHFLGINPVIKWISGYGGSEWKNEFFDSNNLIYSQEEQAAILYNWALLNNKFCTLAVVYAPCFEYVDILRSEIQKTGLKIVGEIDLDINDIFENWIYNLYGIEWFDYDQARITKKIDLLKRYEKKVKIIVLEGLNAVECLSNNKEKIRQSVPIDTRKFISFHAPDSIAERDYMLDVSLKEEFYSVFRKIDFKSFSESNRKLLFNLDSVLKKNNIDKSSICIVGGMALATLGLRESSGDIDILVDSEIRSFIGPKAGALNREVDIVSQNYSRCNKTDDQIIYNKSYHYHFMGYKVVSPDILYERKKRDSREKDICDTKKLAYFLGK